MAMLASIPMRRRCEIVGAQLVRPGVRLNPELGQLYSLSEVYVSSGYINMGDTFAFPLFLGWDDYNDIIEHQGAIKV